MKRMAWILAAAALVPSAAAAQLEIGVDAGVSLATGFEFADNQTTISIPTGQVRAGFGVSDNLLVETLLSVTRTSAGDVSSSLLMLVPGVNFGVGESGLYVRGEVAIVRASFDSGTGGDSATQFGFGGAVGLRKPIADGPVSWRVEGGFDRFLEDQDAGEEAFNSIRALLGLSVIVG